MVFHDPSEPLTISLIDECVGGSAAIVGCPETRATDLLKVQVLRLDWQRIARIENLDIFTHLRELYLQHNRIQVIEGLDRLRNLEFLALGSNRIRRLENIRHLSKLQVLDLSANTIEDIDMQEVPRALVIFNLVGNPCCIDPGLRQRATSSLPGLMNLNGVPLERPSRVVGVEEYKGSPEYAQPPLISEKAEGNGHPVTLYVTVHSAGESHIVPFHFSPSGNMTQVATRFCAENGLHGDYEKKILLEQMEEATTGRKVRSLSARRRDSTETPESTESTEEPHGGSDHAGYSATDERLHAILNLQRARALAMEESTTSFEQHKELLLSTTRKLVKRKAAAAHGRSGALQEAINKIVQDARADLQLRRARASAENREFAADMRKRIERVMAERRHESEVVAGARAIVSCL